MKKTRKGSAKRILILLIVLVLIIPSAMLCVTCDGPTVPVDPTPVEPVIETTLNIAKPGTYSLDHDYELINVESEGVIISSGSVPFINIKSGSVILNGVTVARVVLSSDNISLSVSNDSVVTKIEVDGKNSSISLDSSINELLTVESADNTSVTISKDNSINIVGLASKAIIKGQGLINKVITDDFDFYDSQIEVEYIAYEKPPYVSSASGRSTIDVRKPEGGVSVSVPTYTVLANGDLRCSDGSSITSPYVAFYSGGQLLKENVYLLSGTLPSEFVVSGSDITYTNLTGDPQNIVVKTSGGTFTVNAPNDEVKHYGAASEIIIKAIKSSSFTENGDVKFVEIAGGNFVVGKDATVNFIHFDATGDKFENSNGQKISIDLTKATTTPSFSRDPITIDPAGSLIAEVKSTNNDFIWLTKVGIIEQVTISSDASNPGTNYIQETDENYEIADQIANRIERNFDGSVKDQVISVSTDKYTVMFDNTDKDFKTYEGESPDPTIDTPIDLDAPGKEAIKNAVEGKIDDIVDETASDKDDVKAQSKILDAGSGIKGNPFIISNEEELLNIKSATDFSKKDVYFKFVNDVDMSLPSIQSKKTQKWSRLRWLDIEEDTTMIHIDLNNHSINNLDCFLFAQVQCLELTNGTINFIDGANESGIIYYVYPDDNRQFIFKNLTFNGQDNANMSHFGPIIAQSYCEAGETGTATDSILIDNVISNVSINNVGSNAYTGGFIGFYNGLGSVTIKNSTFNGYIQSPLAGGFINPMATSNNLTVENLTYNGKILATNTAKIFGANKDDSLVTTVGADAYAKKVTPSTTLLSPTINFGDEIIINHSDPTIDHYAVSVLSWTNKKTCGAIFNIEVPAGGSTCNTGIYKNYFVNTRTQPVSPVTHETAGWYEGYIWRDGDTYMVFCDSSTEIDPKFNATIYVYGFNVSGELVTYQTQSYKPEKPE